MGPDGATCTDVAGLPGKNVAGVAGRLYSVPYCWVVGGGRVTEHTHSETHRLNESILSHSMARCSKISSNTFEVHFGGPFLRGGSG